MNFWTVVLLSIPLLGLLIFGRNPMREMQEQQQEMIKKYGSDEATIMTNIYIEQKQRESGGGAGLAAMFSGGSAAPVNGVMDEGQLKNAIKNSASLEVREPIPEFKPANKKGNLQDDFAAKIPKGAAVAKPDAYMIRDGVEAYGAYAPAKPVTSPEGEKSSYYPPTIKANPAAGRVAELTGKEGKLRSGKPVIFEGVRVYTVDNEGHRVPLPDGVYDLQDGSRVKVMSGRGVAAD